MRGLGNTHLNTHLSVSIKKIFRAFLIAFTMSAVSPAIFANQTCDHFLRQFKPFLPSQNGVAPETPLLNALPQLLKNLAGSETEINYRPDWKVTQNSNGLSLLDFSFIAQDLPGLQRIPSIQVYPPTERPHQHEIRLNLNRDPNGEFEDWNLLERSLDYVAAFAKEDDEFEWSINDRGLVKKLNLVLQATLREIDYTGSQPEILEKDEAGFDKYSDLLWIEMSDSDIEELMARLEDEGIKQKLFDALTDSLFGRSFESNTSWQMKLSPRVSKVGSKHKLSFVLELKPLF